MPKLEYRIEKTDEKKYFFLPFEVPENVEKMDIRYSYTGDKENARVTGNEKNVIDFGLLDENGDDMGTRGSEVRFVTISPNYSTNGYKKKEINKGVWQIIVGAYQIRSEGVTVTYDIEFQYKKHRWLKGDTHLHTNHSDGRYSRDELAQAAIKKGLDYIIITDHNNNLEGLPMPDYKGLTVIKGLELTNYRGHMNLFGADKPYDGSFAINTIDEFIKRNMQAKERGAIQVINHPTCTLCPWLMGFENIHFDAVEVWNGPMRKDNLKAINWWNEQLKEGKRIPITGGSDYHRDFVISDLLGCPTLRVYAESNSQSAILKAIRNGNSVITHSPTSTMIEMKCGDAVVGQETKLEEGLELNVNITEMKKGHVLKVIDNDGIVFESKAAKNGDYCFNVPVRRKGFIRCEIEYNKGFFAKILHKIALYFLIRKEAKEKVPPFIYAITNPIYIV